MKAKKSLGQHFLQDQNICADIVASSPNITNKIVIEVGPGYGALTDAILEQKPKQLFLIEKDQMLCAYLRTRYHKLANVYLIEADALTIKLPDIISQKATIVANLPYNIACALVCDWLKPKNSILLEHLTLMMQKEVVERICARDSTKNYGRLSVYCQLLAAVEKSFDVPKEAFKPMPKITSSILQLKPYNLSIESQTLKEFEQVLRICFSKRRKMLKGILKFDLKDFEALNISPSLRPENLLPEDFLNITNHILTR